MAGIARPSNDILIGSKKEMTDYKILNFISWDNDNPNNLFDEKIDTYNFFRWSMVSDMLTIQINKPCNLYIYSAYGYGYGPLDIHPDTFKKIYDLKCIDEWQLYIENIKPGTYIFQTHHAGGTNRFDSEWFFEEIDMSSKIIKNSIKETILNNKLFQEYCISIEEE